MTKTLNIDLPDEDYWELRQAKSEGQYRSWREMLMDRCVTDETESRF